MTTYQRGDVVLVPFPFTHQTAAKKRPAVIISSNAHNSASSDVVIVAVTSNIERAAPMEESLIRYWREAGLLKPSAIKPAIATIEQTLVLRKLGCLSHADLADMEKFLRILFSL